MIKTKVICTLGPAVDDREALRALVIGGMDVARMNFSHGTHEEQLARLTLFREVCGELDAYIPVLMDTKGPEIRLGVFPGGDVQLKEGQHYTLTTEPVDCDAQRAYISYAGLPRDVQKGDTILLDDGLVELEVTRVSATRIHCIAQNDGEIGTRKGVNVPGVSLSMPSLTEQDKKDIRFAVENNYDYIAVSFVRKKEDIAEIRRELEDMGGQDIRLIAKIENREGVSNLDEIIRVSDGIMVARGDLGVEIPVEQIPVAQKDMILRCYRASKPVITATQMLDSMIRNPRPTRAEVTDVANAILDGTSAIMLSGETAIGRYPIEALQTMKRIAESTENSVDYWDRFMRNEIRTESGITHAISHATCTTAMDLNAAAIVAVTTSGSTARRISGFRPKCPIIAATTSPKARRQLRLSWGVYPVLADVVNSTDELFETAVHCATNTALVQNGDVIVVTAGVPLGISGTTNMLKVHLVGDVLCKGKGLGQRSAMGEVCRVVDKRGAESFQRGDILVAEEINDTLLPLIAMAGGLVLEGSDRDGQAATLAKALELPVVTEAEGALQLLKTGTVVTVDAVTGSVRVH
ncbi:MAG: pyruvate kinase [Oscillospiraceae bacterium]|jgi:pyruvate kinase|nr:pyruvate kinase [Oscillospiraceae bacterium]